ncbi:hypothetical protein NE236_16875 [Actinoallomurus purpureus]|uniref:hypothetical protein n=1 Tax=Actinoallomurus purpureus TaxID=478114 RepID=UPI00209257F5|nr:hypothetical protein [Actinoallomurus purpureus]MCO6006661.1 hypothetical protein [Actinoallomurus purpureus]
MSAAAVTAAAVTALAPPAHADTEHCLYSDNPKMKKTLPTPGKDTRFAINLCVVKLSNGKHWAYADIHWHNGGDSDVDDKRKFDKVGFVLRLERHNVARQTQSCEARHKVNTQKDGDVFCSTKVDSSKVNGGWTADGYVKYDIDRDGKSAMTWNWPDSPSV